MSDLTDLERGDVPVLTKEAGATTAPTVGRNALETIAVGAFSLLVALPTTVITSRYLHPAGRGAFYLEVVTITIAATLVGNIGIAVSHEIKRGVAETRNIVGNGLIVSLALGLLTAVVVVPISFALAPHYRAVALMPIALPALLVSGMLTTTLVAVGRVRARNLLQLALPATTLIGMVVLVVLLAKGLSGAVSAWLIAQTVVFVLALVITAGIWRPLQLGGLSFDLSRRMLLLGIRAGLVNVISLLNYRIELFVLQAYRGIDAVGVYSVSVSLAELLWIVPTAVATATIALAVSASDEEAIAAIARGARAAVAATALAGVALAVVAPFAIPVLFGSRFHGATVPLLILIPGVVAFAPGQILAIYFSMRLGEMRIPLSVSLASAALTGLLAVLIIPPLGLSGAALSTTVGYSVSILIAAVLFSRRAGIGLTALVPSGADVLTYRDLMLEVFRR